MGTPGNAAWYLLQRQPRTEVVVFVMPLCARGLITSLQLRKARGHAECEGEGVGDRVCKLPADVQSNKGKSSGEAS